MSNGSEEAVQNGPAVSLENPFSRAVTDNAELGRYEATLQRGAELRERPYVAADTPSRQRQHLKGFYYERYRASTSESQRPNHAIPNTLSPESLVKTDPQNH